MGEKKRKIDAMKRLSPTARFVFAYTDRSRDTEMAPNPCLGCGQPLTCSTALEKSERPKEGCISICSSCGHIQAFDKDLRFRPLTDEEIVDVAGMEEIVTANNVRARLKEFWTQKDDKGAFEFVAARIRRDVRNARG